MDVRHCDRHSAYHEGTTCPLCRSGGNRYTAFLSHPDTPRGQYDEELDVVTSRRSATRARRIAEAAVELDYVELAVRRVERAWI